VLFPLKIQEHTTLLLMPFSYFSTTKPNNMGLIKTESLRGDLSCQQVVSEGSPALSAAEN